MTISEVSRKYNLSQDTLRYYERVGAIPPVRRSASGLRDYSETDCGWVELVKCMRNAGLPMEALVQYVRLMRQGDDTIAERRDILLNQRVELVKQMEVIQNALKHLDYKISRYDAALETGVLNWE